METAFRWVTLAGATIVALAISAPSLVGWLSAVGWIPLQPAAAQILTLIEPLRQTTGLVWVAGLTIGTATGAWSGWLLRMSFRRKRPETSELADEMNDMIHRMRSVSEACHSSSYDEGAMVLAYSRFQALQLTLQGAGLRVPWRHWEPGEDPVPYLAANIGYLAFIEPLMRKGHLTTAIRTTRISLGLGGAPRGPLMKVGASLRRVT